MRRGGAIASRPFFEGGPRGGGWLLLLLLAPWGRAASLPQVPPPPGQASPAEETPSARLLRIEGLFDRAEETRSAGRFRAALEDYRAILALADSHEGAWRGVAACAHALGRYDDEGEAIDRLLGLRPDDPGLAVRRGEHLALRGHLQGAEATFRKVLAGHPEDFRARLRLGQLLRETGRREDGERELRVLADHAATHVVEDAPRLTWLALAYQALGGYEEAAEALADAIDADRLFLPARLALGDLLLEKYQGGDALREYRLGLEIAPDDADFLSGMARAHLFREQSQDARRDLERALAVNPAHPEALALEARIRFEDRDFEGAKEAVDRILALNPVQREGRSLLGVYHFLRNDARAFEEDRRWAAARDPHDGRFDLTLARILGSLYRFEDGLPFAEHALELDPELWAAHDVAGRFCLNTGRHRRGIEHLRRAQAGDDFVYPWRLNMLQVASIYDEFVTRTTPHFRIFLHVDEARVLRGYLADLLEESYSTLTRRYGFVPENPTIVEVFPDKNDFAVRNVGMPGIDYILGICFGRVITLNSPHANPDGFFSWAQTAWHEFAHVLTLQITRARIPRWLTEGISVYEERRANPIWERRQEMELFQAYHNDKIFPLEGLNGAFRTPRIGFAYYQGSLMVEFLEETRGFGTVLEMLHLYGEDLSTEDVFARALEVSPEDFDRRFRRWVGRRLEGIHLVPQYDRDSLARLREAAERDPCDPELQAKLAWAYYSNGGGIDCEAALGRALELDPGSALANLLRGYLAYDRKHFDRARVYLEKGLAGDVDDAVARLRIAGMIEGEGRSEEAVRAFERAKRAFPQYTGSGNAYQALERIYRARGDEARAMREVRALADLVNTDVASRRKLVAWYRSKGDLSRTLRTLVEILWVVPFDPVVHRDLADTYRDLGRRSEEARELSVGVTLAGSDAERVGLLGRLARVERALGRADDARGHLEEALRLDPDNAGLRAALHDLP